MSRPWQPRGGVLLQGELPRRPPTPPRPTGADHETQRPQGIQPIYTRMHRAHTHTHTRAHTRTHARTCTHAHTHAHARMHTQTHAHACTCTHTCTHTQTHAHTCTYTHTHARACARTHTHTRTRIMYIFKMIILGMDVLFDDQKPRCVNLHSVKKRTPAINPLPQHTLCTLFENDENSGRSLNLCGQWPK